MMCGNMSLIYLIPYYHQLYIYTVGLLVIGFNLLLVSALEIQYTLQMLAAYVAHRSASSPRLLVKV